MRLYASATQMKLDKGRITRALGKLIDDIYYDAIEQFTYSAASAIPIWTGMARGSLLNLKTFVESKGRTLNGLDIPVNPPRAKAMYRHTAGAPLQVQGPKTGVQYSTKRGDIYRRVGNLVTFEFRSDVRHLNINEYKAPWYSFAQGRQAFVDTIKHNKRKLTDVKSFLSTTSITYGKHPDFGGLRDRSRQIMR